MPKVTETRTQDHLREKVTHLNLADYLYDLEAIAKETGELDNLKINYVMNYENGGGVRYELHRLHAIECILQVRRIQLPPASPTVLNRSPFVYVMNVLNSHLFRAGKGRAQAPRSRELES